MAHPPPLTPEMQAVLDRMRRTQSTALVRVGSQWWAAENDVPVGQVDPQAAIEIANSADRRQRDRLMFTKPVFWTGTVAALVRRRELRFVGRRTAAAKQAGYQRAVFRYP